MAKAKRGRASMFRGKEGGSRVQGIITKAGGVKFETARKALEAIFAGVTGKRMGASDADVIEYLARGEKDTREYFERYIGR